MVSGIKPKPEACVPTRDGHGTSCVTLGQFSSSAKWREYLIVVGLLWKIDDLLYVSAQHNAGCAVNAVVIVITLSGSSLSWPALGGQAEGLPLRRAPPRFLLVVPTIASAVLLGRQ